MCWVHVLDKVDTIFNKLDMQNQIKNQVRTSLIQVIVLININLINIKSGNSTSISTKN